MLKKSLAPYLVAAACLTQLECAVAPALAQSQSSIAVFSTDGVYPFVPRYEFKEGKPFSAATQPTDLKIGKNIVWGDELIGNIHGRVLYVKNKAPGLLKLACVRAPIQIFYYDKITVDGEDKFGYAYQNNLLISQDFFTATAAEQQHFFTNAIVQIADVENPLSLNPTWITMARNRITPGDKRYSPPGGSDNWPRYGSRPLTDSLYEYVTDYIEGKKYPDRSQFEQSFAPHVFTPPSDELEWCQLMSAARDKMRASNYEDAQLKIKRASDVLPDEPMSDYYLACAFAYGGNTDMVLTHLQEFSTKMAALNLPKDDRIEVDHYKSLVQIFLDKKNQAGSLAVLEPMCQKHPDEKWFSDKRDLCKGIAVKRLRL